MTQHGHSPGRVFRALHERESLFVMPNPWDVGSARLLAGLGFEALASTSSGFAHSQGIKDGKTSWCQVLEHCEALVTATNLPVSADLENGFADLPEDVAKNLVLAAQTGLAGCSIEDYSGDPKQPIYDFNLAVERIAACAESKTKLPDEFVLTARSENHLWGHSDIEDTIRRLQAFEAAGADVLYAPGVHKLEEIVLLCQSLRCPVNVGMETDTLRHTLSDLLGSGVKRVSLGSTLFLQAYGTLFSAAREIQDHGSFSFAHSAVGFDTVESLLCVFESDRQ